MPLSESDHQQIDELLLEQLSLYDEYQHLQERLGNFMKKGFFNLSKARYSLGATVVSPLSFDMRMQATNKL